MKMERKRGSEWKVVLPVNTMMAAQHDPKATTAHSVKLRCLRSVGLERPWDRGSFAAHLECASHQIAFILELRVPTSCNDVTLPHVVHRPWPAYHLRSMRIAIVTHTCTYLHSQRLSFSAIPKASVATELITKIITEQCTGLNSLHYALEVIGCFPSQFLVCNPLLLISTIMIHCSSTT